MKVFIIGGTGLIGSEAARELISRGHEVKSLALPPLPKGEVLPKEMEITYGNFMEMTDEELKLQMEDCQGFVFAAGIDERISAPPPIYDVFKKFNIDALERVLKIAKEVGIKHTVVCGSYFSYFAKSRPEDNLTTWHPYIRSRIDQEIMCLSYADNNFNVAILELPYIFGTQPGRKPVWVFLVEQILSMKKATLYPPGGTTMMTVKQVAQAIAGALEKSTGGVAYPIGFYNMSWKEMLTIFHKHMGMPERKIITIPRFLFKLSGRKIMKENKKAGIEMGLNMVEFAKLQCSNQFIDKALGSDILGVTEDDIDSAIGESIKLSLEIIEGRFKDAVDMKGE